MYRFENIMLVIVTAIIIINHPPINETVTHLLKIRAR